MIAQRSPEWFALRCGRATGSRFADIMATLKSGAEAASVEQYRAQLICERLTGKVEESFSSRAMLAGTELEPDARAMYEAETSNLVSDVDFVQHHRLMAGASPDGLIGADGCLEIKCPTAAVHGRYLFLNDEQCPSEYVAQVQGQLWITDRKWSDFVSYNPSYPPELQLVVRRVARDDQYISALSVRVESFLITVDTGVKKMQALIEARRSAA